LGRRKEVGRTEGREDRVYVDGVLQGEERGLVRTILTFWNRPWFWWGRTGRCPMNRGYSGGCGRPGGGVGRANRRMRVVRLVEVVEDWWRGREEDIRIWRWMKSEIPSALFPPRAKR
jgi:hypothetical protein